MAGTGFRVNVEEFDASVALGASASAEIHLVGTQPTALIMPAVLDATTVLVAFKVGWDTGSLDYLRNMSGTLITATLTGATNTNTRIYLDHYKFCHGWRYIQVVLLSDATPTVDAQAAARTITLLGSKVI